MKSKLILGVFIILLIVPMSSFFVSAQEQKVVNVWFFYATWCPHCHKVISSGVLDSLESEANITKFVIDKDPYAQKIFMEITNYYKISAGVPTALIFENDPLKGKIIQGDEPIIKNLPKVVEGIETKENGGGITLVKRNIWKDLALVIGTGAADSVNPCIISVLALLIMALTTMKSYKKILKLSILYTIIVFVTYLIIGILIVFGAMLLVNKLTEFALFTGIIKTIVAVLLLIAGAINIKDFFWYGKGISFSLSPKYKNLTLKLAKRASIPAILILGLVVTIIEFPCSGMMYLGIITYFVSQAVNPWLLLQYLIIYNLVFIIPLILIMIFTLSGKKISNIESFRLKYRKVFRLVMGIVLIGLACLILVI